MTSKLTGEGDDDEADDVPKPLQFSSINSDFEHRHVIDSMTNNHF